MKKADIIIIAAALAACTVFALLTASGKEQTAGHLRAEIYVKGNHVQTIELSDIAQREFTVAGGKITVLAESDGLSVIRSDCPEQACVHTGKITIPGQLIACLPNRAVIMLAGGSGGPREVDIIAR